MPLHHTVPTLRKASLISVAKNWDLICYAVHSPREMGELIESDDYLKFTGPFTSFPSTILEDLMEVIRAKLSLSRKFLHLLLGEQLLKLNLSLGVGEVYYGLEFLPRCKRLRDLNLGYLRHVEPCHIIPVIPFLSSMTSLNLGMSSANDILLRRVAEHCPNLCELNLQSTYITDDGLFSLCGQDEGCGMTGVNGCPNLQRLIVSETRVTWIGAYEVIKCLQQLRDFDFDKIFQVFEHLDPNCLALSQQPRLKLRSFYSTTPSIRGESIDAAASLCPHAEILSMTNCWMDNDTFYKFMQFEHLKTLTIFNSEGKTIDYGDGILPLLQVVGPTLENLILSKFDEVDLSSLGHSCPRLRKIALSGIVNLDTSPQGPEDGIFNSLTNVELWLDTDNNSASYNGLLQLLQNSVLLENLLIKKSCAFDLNLLKRIWTKNAMPHLSRLTLDQCTEICGMAILEFLQMENELSTIRLWSCSKVTEEWRGRLRDTIATNNYDVYLEWFE